MRTLWMFPLIGLILAVIGGFFVAPAVLAGGWAVVTLDRLPTEIVAGEPVAVGFMVRQHGRTPADGLAPKIKATQAETGEAFTAPAWPEGQAGHYVAEVTFPSAGVWGWSIDAFSFAQPMPSLAVLAAAPVAQARAGFPISAALAVGLGSLVIAAGATLLALRRRSRLAPGLALVSVAISLAGFAWTAGHPPRPVAQAHLPDSAEFGQALFLAKGCVVCHQHQAMQEARRDFASFSIGPNLTSFSADPAYLRLWLKNPSAVKSNATMPTLGLSDDEIEALIAFLNPHAGAESAAPSGQLANPRAGLPAPEPKLPVEPFFVRALGANGPLVVYDMAGGREQFRLPAGMPSADGRGYYATALRSNHTALNVYDPIVGKLARSHTLNGQWRLSGVSPQGRWLALTRLAGEGEKQDWTQANRWQTDIQIFDARRGHAVHSMSLEGNFEVETISAAGDALFLVQHLPAVNPSHYLIRLYDLSTEELQPGALRAKTATDEVMTGLAWGGIASPDGRWLLTLYLNTQRNVAFIHALNLVEKFPVCIDLPSGNGDFERLKAYTLALSPDGRRVYAANSALGVVAEISLDSFEVIRQAEFSATVGPETANARSHYGSPTPAGYSVLAEDGQTLYFTNGWDVWAYRPGVGTVEQLYASQSRINGLGLSRDNRRLYIAAEARPPLALEVASDRTLSFQTDFSE